MDKENLINTATKYQAELNSRYSNYSKQGSFESGNITKKTILNIMKQQSPKKKASDSNQS